MDGEDSQCNLWTRRKALSGARPLLDQYTRRKLLASLLTPVSFVFFLSFKYLLKSLVCLTMLTSLFFRSAVGTAAGHGGVGGDGGGEE